MRNPSNKNYIIAPDLNAAITGGNSNTSRVSKGSDN